MLSKVFLTFQDPEMKAVFEREKRSWYSKIMPVILLTIIVLASTLEILYRVNGLGELEMTTSIVNGSAILLYIGLTCLVRCSHVASWFVCPSLTALTHYYFAWVDYDGQGTSIYYTMIVGITVSFFLLVLFSEVWLISTAVYSPLLAYYMWKTGKDMVGNENQELLIRCLFCVFLYAIVAYKVEMLNKQAFMGKESSEKAFYRWLKIFETFPEGLALVRNGYIMYANQSLHRLFEFDDYVSTTDPYNEHLKKLLTVTEVTRLGKDTANYTTSVWNFLDGPERGAPFSLQIQAKESDEKDGKKNLNADGSRTKYISLNKVLVNVAGSQDKLFVVRDLSSMVNLQKIMYTK